MTTTFKCSASYTVLTRIGVFWNSTFSPVLEFTEGIFLTAFRRELSNGANPGCVAASVLKLFKFFLRPTQLGHNRRIAY